jgi:hypothetical protein
MHKPMYILANLAMGGDWRAPRTRAPCSPRPTPSTTSAPTGSRHELDRRASYGPEDPWRTPPRRAGRGGPRAAGLTLDLDVDLDAAFGFLIFLAMLFASQLGR